MNVSIESANWPNELSADDLAYQTPQERAELDQLLTQPETALELLADNRSLIFDMAGLPPDDWQSRVVESDNPRKLLLCTRQAGKSTTAAALALLTAFLEAPALILLLSPTLRQSGELFRDKVLRLYNAMGRPVEAERQTALELHLQNGSRIVSLPENEEGIRGFSGVSLLVIDEASRVSDALYRAVRPMLAVSNGRLVALSTPFGKRGWFFEEYESSNAWERYKVTAQQCPRISRAFLREEYKALGERWYRQEYLCSFEDTVDAVFSYESIQRALNPDLEPWFPEPEATAESEWFGDGDLT